MLEIYLNNGIIVEVISALHREGPIDQREENMVKYESIVVFNPSIEEEKRSSLLEKFKSIIETDGSVESIDDWGVKRLAYEINKGKEGYYYLVNFEANPNLINELERNYRISEDVIRYNVIKK